MVCDHCIGAFFPVHWAYFAVFFEVLECIDDAEALADGAAERHVVDDLVADDALHIDEEEAAVSYEFTGDDGIAVFVDVVIACEHVVVFGDGFVDVGYERVVNALDAAFVFRGLEPGPVGKFGVGGASDDGDVALFKLAEFFLEAVKLCRADEGEVLRVEEEYDVFFPNELIEGEIFDDGFAFDGFCGKSWCWFAY